MLLHLLLSLLSWNSARTGCNSIPDSARVAVVGAFSDMRYTEEHAYGHLVELWSAGGCLFGFLEVSEGLAADTPLGELTQVRGDDSGGKLSFRAKLTLGTTRGRETDAWVPSRELFTFNGSLSSRLLKGTLGRSDQLRPDLKPVEESIVLRLDPDLQGGMIQASTYDGWRKAAEPILRFRGPKW
jgi:hypothetical protein